MTRTHRYLTGLLRGANNARVPETQPGVFQDSILALEVNLKLKNRRLTIFLFLISAFLICLPLIAANSAGGSIEGKVTDPKGAVVVGATVIVTDQITNQVFKAATDKDGHYKVEGLPAGNYLVVVSAPGFS